MLLPRSTSIEFAQLEILRDRRSVSYTTITILIYVLCVITAIADIRIVLLVSHIDKVDRLIKEDLQNVARSARLCKIMRDLSTATGIPLTNILPICNHHEGFEISLETQILNLMAMRLLMDRAHDGYAASRATQIVLPH